jgi:hypothetical protein
MMAQTIVAQQALLQNLGNMTHIPQLAYLPIEPAASVL